MSAIILDGQLKSALAATRSLGQAGIVVTVGAERKTGMALHSRYARRTFVYPSPYTDQKGFIVAVKAEALRLGSKPLIYAFSDATYLSLFAFRSELEECAVLVLPPEDSIHIAFDKAATYSLAKVSQVPTIPTYTVDTRAEVEQLGKTGTFPMVVKTRRSVTWHNERGVFGSASFVTDAAALTQKFLDLKEKTGEAPLVQHMMYGEEYGVEMLTHKGESYATVVHHRIRSMSPTGGASVLKETLGETELASVLRTHAERLVKKLMWEGPVMVEFKVDSDSREPYLMEINGRFWGSLPLSVAAGVDMPVLLYRAVKEQNVPEKSTLAHGGVVTRHFLGDVRHLVRVLFASDPMRKLLYPSRKNALRDFFRIPKGTQSDVWSLRDPQPAFFEIVDVLAKSWYNKI